MSESTSSPTWSNVTADELKVGMKVKPYWHPLANGEHLLMWQPDKDAA